MKNVNTLFDTDIAMMEHKVLDESDIMENHTEGMMWYIAGVHDMAQRVIEAIQNKEEF